MSDFPTEGDEGVAVDTAADDFAEDHTYDTLEEAAAALGDDDEGEAQQESEGDEAPEEGEQPADEVKITLTDGTEVPLSEIERGFLRQDDYTRKTTEIAQERERVTAYENTLKERASLIETAQQKLVALVQGLIPPEPDAALAQSNPAQYVQALAMRQQAMTELQGWLDAGDETAKAVGALTEAQTEQARQAENDLLIKARPGLKDPAALAKFDSEVASAAKQFGFPDEMIAATHDHRVRQMAYYAAIGLRAEANRKAAQRRVENPKPGNPAPAKVQPTDKSKQAMRRLSQTGSFKDAMKIDF